MRAGQRKPPLISSAVDGPSTKRSNTALRPRPPWRTGVAVTPRRSACGQWVSALPHVPAVAWWASSITMRSGCAVMRSRRRASVCTDAICMGASVAGTPAAMIPCGTSARASLALVCAISSRRWTSTMALRPRAATPCSTAAMITVLPIPVGPTSSGARAPSRNAARRSAIACCWYGRSCKGLYLLASCYRMAQVATVYGKCRLSPPLGGFKKPP